MDRNLSKLQEIMEDREAWYAAVNGLQRVRHDLAIKQQQLTLFVSTLECPCSWGRKLPVGCDEMFGWI